MLSSFLEEGFAKKAHAAKKTKTKIKELKIIFLLVIFGPQ